MIARVYSAIHAVTTSFSQAGIAKHGRNRDDDYDYRSIDDLYAQLSPLLAEHKLCVLPRVLERTCAERVGADGEPLTSVAVRCAFDLVSVEDGSAHTIEAFGEALDHSDKATAKAITAAYKSAMFQAFCIPAVGSEDADAASPRLGRRQEHALRPEQGWHAWAEQLQGRVCRCTSSQDLTCLQNEARELLGALSREQPELYQALGAAITAHKAELAARSQLQVPSTSAAPRKNPPRAKQPKLKVAANA